MYQNFLTDHKNIIEICKAGKKIPPLSVEEARKLLKSIKSSVTDLFSISSLHYINGGDIAVEHFCLLLNAVLGHFENFVLAELNSVYAIILHKGHGKDKHSDRSYRTISSCPFLAKCADIYVGSLSATSWSSATAETKFQRKGMSHEHAGLLLTETINYIVNVKKLPVFSLYLDAKSAFDRAIREILTRRMYLD